MSGGPRPGEARATTRFSRSFGLLATLTPIASSLSTTWRLWTTGPRLSREPDSLAASSSRRMARRTPKQKPISRARSTANNNPLVIDPLVRGREELGYPLHDMGGEVLECLPGDPALGGGHGEGLPNMQGDGWVPQETGSIESLRTVDAHGQDRGPGPQGDEGCPQHSRLEDPGLAARPFGEDPQSQALLQDLLGLSQGIPVGSLLPYREGTKAFHYEGHEGGTEEFLLGHKDYPAGDASADDGRVRPAQVIGDHNKGARLWHIPPPHHLEACNGEEGGLHQPKTGVGGFVHYL